MVMLNSAAALPVTVAGRSRGGGAQLRRQGYRWRLLKKPALIVRSTSSGGNDPPTAPLRNHQAPLRLILPLSTSSLNRHAASNNRSFFSLSGACSTAVRI